MTPIANHEEIRAALAAHALDALDADERERVQAHLEECDECRRLLGELRDAAAALSTLSPERPMDASRSSALRERLVARAAADIRSRETGVTPAIPIDRAQKRSAGLARGGWLAAAVLAALLVGTGAYLLSVRERAEQLSERVAAIRAEQTTLEAELRERERQIASLIGPSVQVIDLAAVDQRAPSGRMFWDQETDNWTFVAHDLPAVSDDRTYQLWLITPGRRLSAGTFRPGPQGNALVRAEFALPADSLRMVAVTEEPEGGLPQPSGPIIIAGEVGR